MWPALAGGAVALGIVWGVYEMGHSAGRDSCAAAAAREAEIGRLASAAAAEAAASAIAGIKVQHKTIQAEVRREIVEKPVYADCRHSDEQLRRLNAIITGQQPEPAGSGIVPRTGPADGFQFRGHD